MNVLSFKSNSLCYLCHSLKIRGKRRRCICFHYFNRMRPYIDTDLKCNPHKREESVDMLCILCRLKAVLNEIAHKEMTVCVKCI